MASALVRAAAEFLREEEGRTKRPKFSQEEQQDLRDQLNVLINMREETGDEFVHSCRGAVAVKTIGYVSDFEDAAVNVIADILQAVDSAGLDAMTIMAHARAEFFRDRQQNAEESEDAA